MHSIEREQDTLRRGKMLAEGGEMNFTSRKQSLTLLVVTEKACKASTQVGNGGNCGMNSSCLGITDRGLLNCLIYCSG